MAVFTDWEFECLPLPAADGDLLAWLRSKQRPADGASLQPLCVVEQVDPLRFQEAERFGFIRGAAQALGFRLLPVRPEVWQADFRRHHSWGGLRPREFDNKLLNAAARFFPKLAVAPGTAEALTLLVWAGGSRGEGAASDMTNHRERASRTS